MKKIDDLNKLAKQIIAKNQYVSLATADADGNPWISPVVYTHDKDWNLYFISMPTSRHCKNIKENGKIAAAIFDSHQPWGEGVGLQIVAISKVVTLREIPKVVKLYALRKYPFGGVNTKRAMNFAESMIFKKKTYKIYKITPKSVFLNDPNSKIDRRVEVNLHG